MTKCALFQGYKAGSAFQNQTVQFNHVNRLKRNHVILSDLKYMKKLTLKETTNPI